MELLIVVAVLALLLGLLLPVLAASRRKASESTCVSHLRQIGQAFQMYLQDYHTRPPRLHDLAPRYVSDRRLFTCPADAWVRQGGWAWASWGTDITPPEKWPFPVSYGYFFSNDVHDPWWEQAQAVPGQPGYAVCVLHGQTGEEPNRHGIPHFTGRTLRLCFDGAVIARDIRYKGRTRFNTWKLMTDQDAAPGQPGS